MGSSLELHVYGGHAPRVAQATADWFCSPETPAHAVNRIFIGIKKHVELPKGGCLVIEDEVRNVARARVFDPLKHSFNPLKNLDYRRACDFIDILDALFSRGESTLTKDTGLDFIAEALDAKPKTLEDLIAEPDKKSTTGHIWAYGKIRRILRSPVLKRMLCTPRNEFSFNPRSVILARVNRAELSEFDSLVIGLLLMSVYRGQIVLPDGGFYLRDTHSSLIREGRLVVGVNSLSELSPKLRNAVLLIEDKVGQRTTYDDAFTLAQYAGLVPQTTGFNDFVNDVIS